MHLVLVLESWGIGGTEQYVSTLCEALKRLQNDLRISVVLLNQIAPVSVLEEAVWVDSVRFVNVSASRRPLRYVNSFRQVFADLSPDIVHLHTYTSTLHAAFAAAMSGNSRVVSTFHSPLSQWSFRHRLALRASLKFCDAVIGASLHTTNELRPHFPYVISASPPIREWESTKLAGLVGGSARFKVVGCGRLSKEKDWGTLLSAMGMLRGDSERKLELLLIGEGAARDKLQLQITDLGLERSVTLVGQKMHDEAMEIISQSDLFVLPSLYEGFGMSAVEAMMLGVPVITSDFPASAEYINEGVTGQRFPIGDHNRLAELIQWHLKHPEESGKMGLAGQTFAKEHYQPRRIAEIHHEIYRDILGKSS